MIRGPKRKKLGHFGFSTSKLRSGQQIAFGRQSAPGRRFALGPAMRVRPVIRVRPTVGVWPGKTRLASKARFTSKIRTMLHQQGDFPPANTLTTSKPTSRKQARSPNGPSHSGAMPTGEQAGPDGTPPKALNIAAKARTLAILGSHRILDLVAFRSREIATTTQVRSVGLATKTTFKARQ